MKAKGLAYLTTATLTYGALQIVDKVVLKKGIDPTAYTIARVFIALAVLIVFQILRERVSFRFFVSGKHALDFAIIGILASGVGLLLQILGLSFTSATNVSVLLSGVAPLTCIFAYLILGESLGKQLLLASLLMLLGIWLIYYENDFAPFGVGDLLVLAAVTGYAFSNVHAKLTMAGVSTTAVTVGRLIWGCLSLLVCAPFLNVSFQSLFAAPGIVLLGGLIFGLRMLTYYKGIEIEGAAVAATFLLFSPAVVVLSATVFLSEPLSISIIAGVIIVTIGGLILVKSKTSTSK